MKHSVYFPSIFAMNHNHISMARSFMQVIDMFWTAFPIYCVTYLLKIQSGSFEIVTVIRRHFKFTHCDLCCQQYVNAYLPLITHHFSNSGFQTPHMGWYEVSHSHSVIYVSQLSNQRQQGGYEMNVLQTDWKIQIDLATFLFAMWG